jgi:hypothetical protein
MVTAYPHVAKGPTLVTWNSLPLGYSDDRIMIEERPFWEDIRSDAFGGAAGAPSDVHYLGSIAIVSCNLNRFIEANILDLASLDSSQNVGGGAIADGEMPPAGVFMRQDSMYATLLLTSATPNTTFTATTTLSYPIAFLRQGRRFNLGTRHQIFSLVFECHIDDPCTRALFTTGTGTGPCAGSS